MTVDELVVKLTLDPSKFTKGQRDALDAYKKTQEELRKRTADVESGFERMTQAVSTAKTQMLGLFAIFMGGRGFKEFATYLTQTDNQVGIFSHRLETNTQVLSQWRGAARTTGGSADAITGSIRGLVQQFQQFSLTGESSVIPYFRALGINIADVNGKMRPFNDIMLDLASAFEKIGPAKAATFGAALGLDDHTIALLSKGRVQLEGILATQKQFGLVTKEDAAAAGELTQAWNEMMVAGEAMGRDIMTWLTPGLVRMMKDLAFSMSWWKTPEGKTKADQQAVDFHNRLRSRFGGATTEEAPSTTWVPPGAALRAKTGSGSRSAGVDALARSLQNDVPGLKQFTAFNDDFHAGTNSKHAKGLALDFTLDDASKAPLTAAMIRAKLSRMGIDARVMDEYTSPSARSTGGHIHIQFNSADAAKRYSDLSAPGGGAGVGSTTSTQVHINQIVVHTKATDAEGIANDIKPALTGQFATQAQSGPE